MKSLTKPRQAKRSAKATNGRSGTHARVLFPQARHLTRKERAALNAYKNYLVRKLPGQIVHIILYGSKARGDSTSDSDIDLLIVVDGGQHLLSSPEWREIEQRIGDPTYHLMDKYKVFISPLVKSADEVKKWTPLLADIQRDGIEIWRSRDAREVLMPSGGWEVLKMRKEEHVEARMALAEEKLRAARTLFDEGFYNDTISKAYYAMFYASKALLLQLGIDPHKHQGVVSLYGDKIARVGLSDPQYGHVLKEYMNLRLDADYEATFRASKDQAQLAMQAANEFVSEAKRTLERLRGKTKEDESNARD